MNSSNALIQGLKQTAEAIVATFGKNCEVCIHDLTSLHCSLIYIVGNVTGRSVGAPATDPLVKELQKNGNGVEDKHNYHTTSSDGRTLKSSTTFIRDENNTPVAALCINFDTTEFFNAAQTLAPFIDQFSKHDIKPNETFASSTEETVQSLFQQAVEEMGKQPATMMTDEKIRLVELLEQNGTFMLKGAVDQVALLTGVSRYTIYNYLKKIRTRKTFNQL